MNHLHLNKFKFGGTKDHSNPATNNNNNNKENTKEGAGSGKGFLTKIKRYSSLGNKLSRRHLSGSNLSNSSPPSKPNTGSYNMTGSKSEDHRLEIGAPVLISTTTLDADRFEVTEARLKQIGGGIAVNSTIVRTLTPRSSSSEREEEFMDALSTPPVDRPQAAAAAAALVSPESPEPAEQFATPAHQPKESPSPSPSPSPTPPPLPTQEILPQEGTPEPALSSPREEELSFEMEVMQAMEASAQRINLDRKVQSQSVQNLHRSELKLYLHKSPSDLNMNATAPELSLNLPELAELYGASSEDTETPTPSSKPSYPQPQGFLAQQQRFKSIDSFQLPPQAPARGIKSSSSSSLLAESSRITDSKQSLTSCQSSLMSRSQSSAIHDFDLKSVSYQSLNTPNLFVSIDELNEITRQINESEDFNGLIDLEYCNHRDQLRPSERRITLLKNKNSRLTSFNHNKEKLRNGWNGIKNWLGEESTRIKEVVRQQTPLRHIATSRLNLNHSDAGGAEAGAAQPRSSLSPGRTVFYDQPLSPSCEELNDCTDLESSFSQKAHPEDASMQVKCFKDEEQNGFEELRRYVKQGGDFGKELILVLQERADSELIYSKSLSKMANKLNKACRELPGSVAEAWRGVATEMESRSDIHRQMSVSLTNELVKPLKSIVETHHKARKAVESNVDKAARVLSEWRVSEAKAKKASHTAARENEKLQDAMLDVRIQKSPSIALLNQGPNKVAAERELKLAEKDCVKLDNKRKKAEEAVKRADVEYYTLCVRAERARVDWEMAVMRGSAQLQSGEQQRLASMQSFIQQYARLTADMSPILDGLARGLQPQVEACNVSEDIQVVRQICRNAERPSEQLLPDFYCEHTTLAMNRERRKHSLIKLLQLVKTDLERERRSRDGLRGLSQSLSHQDHQNITDKLYHIRSMLTYLEGARLKLHSALLELDHKPRTTHPLAQHIQITRDRTGLQQSILKVPNWLKNNDSGQQLQLNSNLDTSDEHNSSNTSNNNNSSCANISQISPTKNQSSSTSSMFSRSKSNIETFTSQPKIISTTNKALAADPLIRNSNNTNNHSHSHNKSRMVGGHYTTSGDRGQADGGSNQQDSDFDEFSSQDEDDEATSSVPTVAVASVIVTQQHQQQNYYQNAQQLKMQDASSSSSSSSCGHSKNGHLVLGRCKALYSYTPKLYDELELSPGDVIEVHAKQDDGWWLGALRNQVGIFPATYVEECA